MNSVKIWVAMGVRGREARLNPGEAKIYDKHPSEQDLYYEGDLHALLKQVGWHDIFRVISMKSSFRAYPSPSNDEGKRTPWYLSREEALAHAEKMGILVDEWHFTQTANLSEPYLKPIELPVQTWLYTNEKGLYCRLNLHPELDGINAKGKLFFPDRDCAGKLCEGPAIITEVKDKGTYGFFTAEMKQFQAPSEEQLAKYIQEDNLWDATLQFKHGRFGTYVLAFSRAVHVFEDSKTAVLIMDEETGEADSYSYSPLFDLDKHDDTSKVTEEISAMDFMCKGYLHCTFDEWKAKFIPFKFQPQEVHDSPTFISQLFDDAVRFGLLRLRRFQNIDFVTMDFIPQAIASFSAEEMDTLAYEVNRVNQAANNAVKSKVKKGKIKFV